MYFLKAIIDIVIILLLLRILIKPGEASFNQLFNLLFRITDPILKPSRNLIRHEIKAIILTVLCLVVLRGFVFMYIGPMSWIVGAGYSFLSLFQLLFRFYMVIWFVSVLTRYSHGVSFISVLQRAFIPLNIVSRRLGISMRHFNVFSFLSIWILYSLLSFLIHSFLLPGSILSSFSILHALAEGLILIIGLFPGFFSLVIIAGALLSWVSPDPYNPIVQVIYGISEPFLVPFRRIVPNLGGLDISPIIALLCFQIIGRLGQQLVAGLLGIL